MNERIESLAKVAGYDMINKAAMRALGFDVEKFAEVIVKECVSHLHQRGVEGFGVLEERNLKEHFGVEE